MSAESTARFFDEQARRMDRIAKVCKARGALVAARVAREIAQENRAAAAELRGTADEPKRTPTTTTRRHP